MNAVKALKEAAHGTATTAGTDPWAVLQLLLCGRVAAADHLANALRVEAHGHTTFGRTDAIDLFMAHPLVFSSAAQRWMSPQALAVLDETTDGRTVGAFAELANGVIARLWVIGATAPDAVTEPAVAVARDDFMSQLRQRCQGEAADHPALHAKHWPRVVEMGNAVLETPLPLTKPFAEPLTAASSSQAWVMRAFSSGDAVVALYRLRMQANTLPRQAHDRLVLAVALALPAARSAALAQDANPSAPPHPRLALSDPLPEPAPVAF